MHPDHERSLLDRVKLAIARAHAGRHTRRFYDAVKHARAAQDRLFRDLITDNPGGDYPERLGLTSFRYYDDFARGVPIQRYADVAPFIERVRRGEITAMFPSGQRVLMFALTSGTTAEPKYIPITPTVLKDWQTGWNVWGLQALSDHYGCFLRGIVQITSPMNDHAAPSGVPCGAITGLLASTQKRLVRQYYTAPLPVADIRDATAKYYTIMRLSMWRDVSFLVTANPATLILLARTADQYRRQLIRDIHDGTLWNDLLVPPAVRAALAPRFWAQPEIARKLDALAEQHGCLYPKHYWRLGFLAHWTGGTMGLYGPQLPRYFGDVPSRDIGLLASEGRMSIPVVDGTASGILNVRAHFFEFIPAEDYGSARPRTVRMHEVEVGREYFLLLTNASGLYRYDLGDRVRVTGFHGQAPLIEFLSRDAHTASLTGEKLTENQVVLAMQAVCRDDAAPAGDDSTAESNTLVDFVLAPRFDETPYYRLYVESAAMRFDRLAERLDAALAAINVEYAGKRDSGRLGPVRLAVLPDGLLADRDRRLKEARSRTGEQFKHQYLQPRPGLDGDLEARSG